ncbi:hypothetical protein [Georgfuchsia toluolica]|uniref:hypothetical protein n=1 Tax=Georgfuchsia toluolica TaxID=424218 RepID=UPI001C73B35E|nr:hypothetical protein [Georgfuchsia toluolica]
MDSVFPGNLAQLAHAIRTIALFSITIGCYRDKKADGVTHSHDDSESNTLQTLYKTILSQSN